MPPVGCSTLILGAHVQGELTEPCQPQATPQITADGRLERAVPAMTVSKCHHQARIAARQWHGFSFAAFEMRPCAYLLLT